MSMKTVEEWNRDLNRIALQGSVAEYMDRVVVAVHDLGDDARGLTVPFNDVRWAREVVRVQYLAYTRGACDQLEAMKGLRDLLNQPSEARQIIPPKRG